MRALKVIAARENEEGCVIRKLQEVICQQKVEAEVKTKTEHMQ